MTEATAPRRRILIAAIGRNGVIGKDNDMPWHLPEDMRHFRNTTMGGTLLMGRRTFDSIGRALPGRTTVVVTRNRSWGPGDSNVLVTDDLGEGMTLGPGALFVAGGGEIYRQVEYLVDEMVITHVESEPDGDAFFPEYDWTRWLPAERTPGDGCSWVRYLLMSEVPAAELAMAGEEE